MNVTATPSPNSTILLEIEVPPENLERSMDEATRRLARRTRVAGFRPGKAPRVMLERVLGPSAILDEAVELLIQKSYREALVEQGIVPLTEASVEVVQAVEGQPLIFKATVQVPPEVTLGDFRNFNFVPEIDTIDEAKVDQVIVELRDQHATLRPVEDRPAANGDYAVVGFVGTRDGAPFEGGSADRMPIILGEERLIPGFEAHIVGTSIGDHVEFDIVFPDDYGEATLAGKPPISRSTSRSSERRSCRPWMTSSRPRWATSRTWPSCAWPSRSASNGMPSTAPGTRSAIESSSTPWPTRPSKCRRS